MERHIYPQPDPQVAVGASGASGLGLAECLTPEEFDQLLARLEIND